MCRELALGREKCLPSAERGGRELTPGNGQQRGTDPQTPSSPRAAARRIRRPALPAFNCSDDADDTDAKELIGTNEVLVATCVRALMIDRTCGAEARPISSMRVALDDTH
jgi:hypothetical protein